MSTQPEIVIATTLRDRRGGTGVQTQFSTFHDYLVETGYPVRIVSSFSSHAAVVSPLLAIGWAIRPFNKMASLWWHRTWHFRFVRAALRRLFKNAPNVIIYAQDPLAAEAALEARTNDQPVILAMHSPLSEADEWVDHGTIRTSSRMYASMQLRERDLLRNVDKLVFASELQRSNVTSIYPDISTTPSIVMPEFVDMPQTLGGVSPPRDAISVGTLEPRKNHRFLIDVIAAARTAGHVFTLTIVGEGPERRALEAQTSRLGLRDQIDFAGRVNYDIGIELEKHRIYLHASRQESFGLAPIEAMAVGLPIAIGDTGVAELLEDGVEAWIWPDLDHPQLGAELLISLMTNPDELNIVAKRGNDRYHSSFSVQAVAPRLTAYLTEPLK